MSGDDKTEWFTQARFGLFIHWGLYSMAARHEWIKHIESIPDADYQKYFELFEPDLFDPKDWARRARLAGMRYVVVTTKHHEGFCLWDSKLTDYNAAKAPRCRRDLLKELVDAFRAEGIRIGLYYSVADWHHPDCPFDKVNPPRPEPRERDQAVYNQYMRGQIRELLGNYGKIDILWFDGMFPWARLDGKTHDRWECVELASMIRELQPGILINDRLERESKLSPPGEIKTPEQKVPEKGVQDENGDLVVWEGCQTLSGAWGYYRDELTWKSVEDLVRLLVNHVSRGGNMLLNVGPTSRGQFDRRARERLDGLAAWMETHARAIHGCGVSPAWAKEPENCRYTYNPDSERLYLHCFVWPFVTVRLENLAGKVKHVQLLSDGGEIKFHDDGPDVVLELHGHTALGAISVPRPTMMRPDEAVPVIELILHSAGD